MYAFFNFVSPHVISAEEIEWGKYPIVENVSAITRFIMVMRGALPPTFENLEKTYFHMDELEFEIQIQNKFPDFDFDKIKHVDDYPKDVVALTREMGENPQMYTSYILTCVKESKGDVFKNSKMYKMELFPSVKQVGEGNTKYYMFYYNLELLDGSKVIFEFYDNDMFISSIKFPDGTHDYDTRDKCLDEKVKEAKRINRK